MSAQDRINSTARLKRQIGDYGPSTNESCLNEDGKVALYRGIIRYEQKEHPQKVSAYKTKNQISESEENNLQFFREQFIEYICHLDSKVPPPAVFTGDPRVRKINPEAANISLENLLGKQGLELYQLALEEEMNSREYRDAIIIKGTTHFDGAKWLERPVVIVAGPSGCGKSTAARAAVTTASKFLAADEEDLSGNDVVAADGGIIREVSQMRKLAIQIANQQGFTGIKDLHSKSAVLEEVKLKVREAAFATPGIGVVIPETFAPWFTPLNPVRNLMKQIDKLANTKQIFARVEGEDLPLFTKIVAFMGSRRAWKTEGFNPDEPLDLNKEKLAESKAYDARGFNLGRLGSIAAETWYRTHSKDKLSMIITNDLILLQPRDKKWVPAVQGDDGARLFSRNAYEAWNKLAESPTKLDLIAYCDKHAKPAILTSAQIDFAIAQKMIKKSLGTIEKNLNLEMNKEETDEERIGYLLKKREFLLKISKTSPQALDNQENIEQLKQATEEYVATLKERKGWRASLSTTLNTLDLLSEALDKASIEVAAIAKPSKEGSDNLSVFQPTKSETNKYKEALRHHSQTEGKSDEKEMVTKNL